MQTKIVRKQFEDSFNEILLNKLKKKKRKEKKKGLRRSRTKAIERRVGSSYQRKQFKKSMLR